MAELKGSRILAETLETAHGMYKCGMITQERLREYQALCGEEPDPGDGVMARGSDLLHDPKVKEAYLGG